MMASHLLRSALDSHTKSKTLAVLGVSAIPKRNEDANKTSIVVFDTLRTNASAHQSTSSFGISETLLESADQLRRGFGARRSPSC